MTDRDLMRASMPLCETLDIRTVSATADEVVGEMAWAEERCTTLGLLHGGALMALADSVGATCAFLNLPEGAGTSTIESKTNLLRGVRSGAVRAVARPLHVGGSTIVVETELRDDEGRLVAKTTQTQAVLKPR